MPAQCCPCWLWLTGEGEVSVFKQVQRKNELHANSDIITLAKAGSREVYVTMYPAETASGSFCRKAWELISC